MTEPTGLISGRFRLGELLGTGGSASVFAAVDTTTGASVALKLLHPHFSGRPETREAFFAEARRAGALRHPNIAGVLDVGVDTASTEPVAWIALERAPGSSLAEHVGRFGQLTVAEAIAVLDGVLRALEAAHAIGLVHRDVSPANVMVARGKSGRVTIDGVRLLDFGLADAAGRAAIGADVLRSEQAGGRAGVIGNVEYMSPEQVRGAAVDERGDLYQAGAVLYFALTGRAPFSRSTPAETMRAHLETPPPVPSVMDSRIPRQIDRLVVRALLKDPVDRFASAAEMRTELATAATPTGAAADDAGRSSGATRVTAPKRRPEAETVTRVLGSTRVPARSPMAAHTAVQRAGAARRPVAQRRPSRIGAWMSGAGLAVVVAAIIGSVAASAPAVPVAIPSPTAEASASPSPPPTAEPTPSSEPVWTPPPVAEVVVPQLSLSTLADAMRTLADAGLEVGELVVVDSERAGDTVLGSSPEAGTRTAPGAVVSLTVASGFNRVPHVVGLSRADALAALQRAGFTVAIGTRPVAGVAAGTIVGTDPGEGASLALATTVTLLEAELPPRATPSPTPTPTPSPETGV
ncbi:protein kinase domain-containing protein [Agromyces albus]|uniref:non-specific serine/threonine protein kinase n=1 Tax=Agromyces albus TaxID=205332 RepID=A0A4Q2KNJ6_9MICO|nr:PASTA domain-containing protein [Agromyces albus]RXZ66934.1 PASTA domain-containing protein [Agromyces albus]